jgi:fructose-1,6-bisphosphatase/inositol monophosphatase family enzyme
MLSIDPQQVVERLKSFQAEVRAMVIRSRTENELHEVKRHAQADTIYHIDTLVEPLLEDFCQDWAREVPLVLVAEGVDGEGGVEGVKVFPEGSGEGEAAIRVIVDPIDGTRALMYDKRPAWALAGVAPNRGSRTSLRDIEVAVMTELPTSKMGHADVLWAIKGQGARGERVNLTSLETSPLKLQPSQAKTINHGFATISNFFPGTKVLASEAMELLVRHLIGPADVTRATVFEDQYISTGGQFYELIVGHDRFNADLRPLFYRAQHQPDGLCCHPYDCATLLVAEEAGVIITDGLGKPLDGPLDVTTGLAWAGFANADLRAQIEPLLTNYLREVGAMMMTRGQEETRTRG